MLGQLDSLASIESQTPLKTKPKWYKTRVFKVAIVPTILIGYGVSTIQNHELYSSYEAQKDVQKYLGSAHPRRA